MVPTPLYLPHQQTIRIFFGVTTHDNFGRTTYLDVSASNPSKIIFIETNRATLGLGNPGTFDDCGAIPSCCLQVDDKHYLYYVGFQRSIKVPYMLFPGLALSNDAITFKRFSQAPLLDRNKSNFLSYAAPCVISDEGIFKMWLWIGNEWIKLNGKDYLSASIGYAESNDAINWIIKKTDCISPALDTEFSVGRPWVIKENGLYKMFYSVRHIKKMYRLGYAESTDGINWTRKDAEVGIDVSETGWDSEMICYPAVIKVEDRTYLFYNGNNNGETGFGWAELIE